MKTLFFKQKKPLKVEILGVLIFPLILYLFFRDESTISQFIILVIIGVVLLSYSISYEVKKGFEIYKHFCFFGQTIFKTKVEVDFPEYISVFSASFKQENEWGSVSALGTKSKQQAIVIRLFSESKKFTLYKTKNYQEAIKKANELGVLLNIEIYDATKS